MVLPGLGRPEPHGVVMSRNHVHFHPERRHCKIVNHIFAGHDQPDIAANRHVQLIDLFAAIGLLQLPHPLFPDHINVEGIGGCVPVIHVNRRAPSEHRQQKRERQSNPGNFQPQVAVNRHTDFSGRLALVFEKEIDHRGTDDYGKEQAHRHHE